MTYKDFIENIINTRGRFNCGYEYHERHHILPKSCGGSDSKENLIDLYAREHFIAHKLLAEENPHNVKLVQAYSVMAFASNDQEERYQLTPEEYEEARKAFSKTMKEYYKDKTNHPNYGKHLSEETKRKISEANKGNKKCLGRKLSDETKKKIGDANRNPSEEVRQKMSAARKGKHLGGDNSNAKAVVRLSDGKVYSNMKEAAADNDINYSTFKSWVHKNKNFMYYSIWKENN